MSIVRRYDGPFVTPKTSTLLGGDDRGVVRVRVGPLDPVVVVLDRAVGAGNRRVSTS